MALISNAGSAWSSPVTLATDEIWQTRFGSVFVTTNDAPEADDGLALQQGQAIQLRAGLQIRYRKEGTTDALIVREAI